jgi:hypothetical protein
MSPSTRHLRHLLAAGLVLLGLSDAVAADVELVMVEERGCAYCAAWNAEVGPIYGKTAEGRFAPLRRIGISDAALVDQLALVSRPVFTPTFILVEDGRELGRIEGYPGDAFFWGLLGGLLAEQTDFPGS